MVKKEKMSEERKRFLKEFIQSNNIHTVQDTQEALKEMLETESITHLGYEKNEYIDGKKENYRNGYLQKKIHSSERDFTLNIPSQVKRMYDGFYIRDSESAKYWLSILN